MGKQQPHFATWEQTQASTPTRRHSSPRNRRHWRLSIIPIIPPTARRRHPQRCPWPPRREGTQTDRATITRSTCMRPSERARAATRGATTESAIHLLDERLWHRPMICARQGQNQRTLSTARRYSALQHRQQVPIFRRGGSRRQTPAPATHSLPIPRPARRHGRLRRPCQSSARLRQQLRARDPRQRTAGSRLHRHRRSNLWIRGSCTVQRSTAGRNPNLRSLLRSPAVLPSRQSSSHPPHCRSLCANPGSPHRHAQLSSWT